MSATPTFAGQRALVLHRPDEGIDRLTRQLRLLGLEATVQWQAINDRTSLPNLVLVDADQGWDGLFPWSPGEAPMPILALLASEAPGRIAWAIAQGCGAILAKPILASAIYPALVMATSIHHERRTARERLAELEERVRLRPLVHGAVHAIMRARGTDEEGAYRSLRRVAMRRRLAMEHVAAAIIAGNEPVPERV
jgi:AmiR/NasT family two-component response regulator